MNRSAEGGPPCLPQLRTVLTSLLPRFRRFAAVLSGSMEDGDDLVQEACERALTKASQLRDGDRVESWVYRIIQTLWIDHCRSRRGRVHQPLESAAEIVGDYGCRIVEIRSALKLVRREVALLPEEQRLVLLLVGVDGFSYQEAADTLGIPIGTVMSRFARGRLILAERVGAKGFEIASNVTSLR